MSRTTARTGIRIAVVTGAAVLCAGGAVPALAHDSDARSAAGYHHELSFAEQKQQALRMLTQEAGWLTSLKAKVAADDRLTADQKSAFTEKLNAALARVAAARTAVENAGSRSELQAALQKAELPYLAYPKYVLPSLADVKAAATCTLDALAQRLTDLRSKVGSDDRLSAGQKARYLDKIDGALAKIARAKDAVAAATTRAQVRAALDAADVWPGHYPRHHRAHPDRSAKLVSATTPAHRSVIVHRAAKDPRWGRGDHRCDGDWGRHGEHDGDWGGHRDGARHHDGGGFGGSGSDWGWHG